MTSWDGILVTACALCLAACTAEPNRLIVKHQFPIPTFLTVGSYSNTTILYSKCKIWGTPKKVCEIVLETNEFDGTNKTLSCEVDMNTDYRTSHLVHVGESNAVVVQYLQSSLVEKTLENTVLLTNIDLNDCRVWNKHITLPPSSCSWDIKDAIVFSYNDSYDVIIRRKTPCDERDYRSTYDLEGNEITELSIKNRTHHSQNNDRLYANVKFYHFVNGQIWSNNSDDLIIIVQGPKILRAWSVENANDQLKTICSTAHDIVGACLQESSRTASCVQFSLEGYFMLNITLDYLNETILAMHNLPEGFLILTTKCMNLRKKVGGELDNCQDYYLKHFDGNGTMVKTIQVDGFQWNQAKKPIMVDLFESEMGYCMSLFTFNFGIQFFPRIRPARLELTAQCYPDL